MTAAPLHDDDALERARRGDPEAFGRLVARHQHHVYGLALRILADPHLAADAAQDAFLRAWRSLAGFRGDARFSTWLYRITVNAAYDRRRAARRHDAAPLDGVEDEPVDTAPGPEAAGELADLRAELEEALSELPIHLRTVVVLKDVCGWSHPEIAHRLGITVPAAKVRLHRARQRLRVRLAHRGSRE